MVYQFFPRTRAFIDKTKMCLIFYRSLWFLFQVPSDGEYENHSESEKLLRKGELRVGRKKFQNFGVHFTAV